MLDKITGHGSFEVDESFVFSNIKDQIDDEERELLNLFVEQSQELMNNGEGGESSGEGIVPAEGAFYRICDVPSKPCDDSPLVDIEYPDRISGRKGSVFGHEGQMIQTDGTGKNVKLSKVYKRGDNRGALLKALNRMKLC
jgi:hypothetical protein